MRKLGVTCRSVVLAGPATGSPPAKTHKGPLRGGPPTRVTRKLNGFTLVELLVVVAIIGLMSTLLMTNFVAARERSRDAQRKSELNQIRNALRLYYNDFQKYPVGSNGTLLGCGTDGDTACPTGDGTWTAKTVLYMQKFPKDPKTQTGYYYERSDLDSFKLTACLENLSDTSGQASINGCAWGYQISEQ